MPCSSDTNQRDQSSLMDKDRKKFTAGVIRAIEELQVRRLSRSPQQLADAAWQKLQYDFPLLDTEELQALVTTFRASFVGKAGWPCYLMTHKALENISSGARGAAGSYAPQLSEQEQQVQQMLAESLTNRVMGRRSSECSSNTNAVRSQSRQHQQQQAQQQQPVSQQQLYQELAAVLLLQYAAKVASLPDQEAWQLLQAYCPEHTGLHNTTEPLAQQQQQQQQANGTACLQPSNAAAYAAAACSAEGLEAQTASSCSVYEDTEAAQQDADSDEYEPLEAPQQQQQQHSRHSATQGPSTPRAPQLLHAQDPQPFGWPALQHKLLSLSEHVHYSLLNHEPLWKQQGAAQHLLQLLRLLGVHSHTQELQPLLHAYVGLLVDRLAAAPQDLPLLHQLWEALGLLTAGPGLKPEFGGPNKAAGLHGSQQGSQHGGQQGLLPEAVLGLSVAAAVWGQLPNASARRQLWQVMYADLLPLLESCAEQLAYGSSSKGATAPGGNSSNGAAGAACTQGVAFAHVLLLSHVVELLVLGRPGPHVDAAKQLTDVGVMRSLVQLHLQWGMEAAAEPLRRAVLLACCSSPHVTAWVLAVPNMRQQLQQQCFQVGGPCESHGALWQLLMHPSSAQLQKQGGAKAAGPAACSADDGAAQQLVSLLQLDSRNVQGLQRQVVLLHLMADAQKAAGSQQRLWGKEVQSALRKLAAQLKEMDVSAGRQAGTTAARSSRCSDADSEDDGGSDVADSQQQERQQPQVDHEQLGHRRSAQLQPAALRLVKELLSQGGGKTD